MRATAMFILNKALFILAVYFFGLTFNIAISAAPPPNNVSYYNDPSPTVTVIEEPGKKTVVLRKELGVYGNYGVADRAANILYTGEVATWTFSLPSDIDPNTVQQAVFRSSLISDDHWWVSLGGYFLSVWTNQDYLGNSLADLPHGSPHGGIFSNWVQRDYTVTAPSPSYSITLYNTSSVGNWFAVDYIELYLTIGDKGSLKITEVSPEKGGANGNVTIKIKGTNLPLESVDVILTAPGFPDITAQSAIVISHNELEASFNLTEASPGLRDVVTSFSGGDVSTLNDAFEIINAGGPLMALDLLGPAGPRLGRDNTYMAVVRNIGLNDIPYGEVEITFDDSPSLSSKQASTSVSSLLEAVQKLRY